MSPVVTRVLPLILDLPPVRARLRARARNALASADRVVFVCLGNICRSPFAEALMRTRLSGVEVISAGTLPESGRQSPELAIASARRWAVNLEPHRSRSVDPEFLREGDALFVFDVDNLVRLWRRFPQARWRLHLAGALADRGPLVVADPYGGTASDFDRAYERIAEIITAAGLSAAAARRSPGPRG
jgi:protein-tyrosine phosphatase